MFNTAVVTNLDLGSGNGFPTTQDSKAAMLLGYGGLDLVDGGRLVTSPECSARTGQFKNASRDLGPPPPHPLVMAIHTSSIRS